MFILYHFAVLSVLYNSDRFVYNSDILKNRHLFFNRFAHKTGLHSLWKNMPTVLSAGLSAVALAKEGVFAKAEGIAKLDVLMHSCLSRFSDAKKVAPSFIPISTGHRRAHFRFIDLGFAPQIRARHPIVWLVGFNVA